MPTAITATHTSRTRAPAVLVFLTLLNVLNFADRFLMQGFAVDLTTDLHLTNLQFTLLTGFVFTTSIPWPASSWVRWPTASTGRS
jgi:hypothetical protein